MEAFKSILYLVSILVTTCTIFLTKKRSEKLNGVSYYFISILIFLCYQVFVRITVNKVGISGSIVTMTIMNYALSFCCIYWITKKGIQKYYIEVFDIILMFVIAGIAIYLGGRQFGWHFDYFNYQSSTDCSRHLMYARTVAKDPYVTGTSMPFMAINTGLFLEAMYTFIIPYEDVRIFIVTDIIMIFFHGNVFFALIRNKLDKKKLLLTIGGAASVFYMMGYPLNNMVFGTSYLGAGMLVSIFVFILIDRYENKEIGTKFFLVSIVLALLGVLKSYQLFFPIVLVGVLVYYINKNIISRNAILQKYTAWILSGLFLGCALVIGLYFKFLPFGRSKVGSLGAAGYMYCSLFGDFIFLLPILVYRIYRCYKTKAWTFDFIMGMFMISYVMAFLYACYLGQVSPYYYYKNYYLFWAVAFYMVMQTVSAIEKERLDGITVYFLSILALWVFTFGGIESVIEEKSDVNGQQINYELHGRSLFRLYSWNYDFGRKEAVPIPMSDDIIELYHKVADISISEGEQIQCLNCILFGYFEYYALAYQDELLGYEEKQYGSQYMLDKVLNDGDKYTCVIYETCKEIEPETQGYLDTYEKYMRMQQDAFIRFIEEIMIMRRKIQSILLPNDEKFEWKWNLFYKGDRSYLDRKNKTLNIGLFQRVDFVTYLNGCSIKKWEQYTCVEDISLQLDMEGDFIIVLTGCHMDTDIPYQKEISQHEFHLKERQTIEIPYPENDETIIGFEIVSLDKTIFYGGAYIAECEEGKQREVVLSIATTTCKKEEFIKKNIALLQSELFENGEEEIKEHIFVHVVDNGRTLDPAELESDNVKVHPNLNTGGSGGFARGMIESMHQTPAVTNVLLMDDDVIILPESIRKTYILLTLLKPEYYEHFISGAMLLYEEMNVQHEDIGHVYGKGDLKAIKPRLYHEHLWDILKNEEEYTGMKNTYAGWWYCCIPVTQIKKNGLPLPVFIRADDIEYSLRSKAQIITMNGICIWHMGFTNKINASFDLYQKIRNYMIAQSTTSVLTNMDIYGMWTDAFWREVYRFNYNAAELLLRALEDYMKGPAFIEQNLGEAIVIENNKKNEKMLPIAECCDYEINLNEVFNDWKRKFIEKCLYHLTANGHRFWPEKLLKRKPGIIPFAYVVVIQKQTLRKTLISVNPYTKTAAIRTINKKRYHELVKRYRKDVRMYKAQKEKIANEYKTRREYITSEEFWRKYLEI